MWNFCIAVVLLVLLLAPAGHAGSYVPGQICCLVKSETPIDEINARWGTTTVAADIDNNFYLVYAGGIEDLEGFAKAMMSDEDVELAEPNYLLQSPEAVRQMVLGAVGGTWAEFADQTLVTRIGLAEAHQVSRGAGVTVAILDTGIDPDHSAFAGRLSEFVFDAVDNDQSPWEVSNGFDDDQDGIVDEGYGHGTMVAGLIALVAPEAEIMPIRVLDDEGRGTIYAIAEGMMKAISHNADIINLSFGAPRVIATISEKLHVGDVHQTIAFAGAGNRNQEEPPYHPACDDLAYMVAALDSLDGKAAFSDYHADVFLSAPGVGLRSAYPGDDWAIGSGCSFATPLVSAAAALILSSTPGLDRELLAQQLAGGAVQIDDLPANGTYRGKLGGGRLDLPGALTGSSAGVPQSFPQGILQAWPNPSTGGVCFRLPVGHDDADALSLDVFDPAGRLVRSLQGATGKDLRWDCLDLDGQPVAPGIYLARVEAGDHRHVTLVSIVR
ncbi:MAG: S8 family serine peptidase [Candidatus Eisenbacteria sp.]|nr:S8 family serine peptidase [Candidatus Eisenbacteria bacterium]